MKKKYIGSSFDDFLKQESIFDHSSAVAVRRVIAWQIEQEMIKQRLTKTLVAKKMLTSWIRCKPHATDINKRCIRTWQGQAELKAQ